MKQGHTVSVTLGTCLLGMCKSMVTWSHSKILWGHHLHILKKKSGRQAPNEPPRVFPSHFRALYTILRCLCSQQEELGGWADHQHPVEDAGSGSDTYTRAQGFKWENQDLNCGHHLLAVWSQTNLFIPQASGSSQKCIWQYTGFLWGLNRTYIKYT